MDLLEEIDWRRKVVSKIWRDAILAGLGGTLGGWALFILWAESYQHLWILLTALAVASVAGLLLEHLREVVLAGHGELDRKSIGAIVVGLVMLVVTVELFTEGVEHLVELTSLLPSVLAALVGDDLYQAARRANIPAWWSLIGLVGIWAYSGIALTCWLCEVIVYEPPRTGMSRRRQVLLGILKGMFGGLLCALAMFFALLGFRLFLMLADLATYEETYKLIESKLPYRELTRYLLMPLNLVASLWHLLLDVLGRLGLDYLGAWQVVPALLMTGVFLMWGLEIIAWVSAKLLRPRKNYFPSHVPPSDVGWGFYWMIVFFVFLVGPLVIEAPGQTADLLLLAVVVWIVPGAVLGGLIPFLQRTAQSPGLWLGMALLGGGLVLLAVWLRDHRSFWLLFSAGLIVVALFTFRRQNWADRPRSELWPLFVLTVPLLMCGPVAIRQELSYRFLGDLHTLMSVQPAAAAKELTPEQQQMLQQYLGWIPRSYGDSPTLLTYHFDIQQQLEQLQQAEQSLEANATAEAEKAVRAFLGSAVEPPMEAKGTADAAKANPEAEPDDVEAEELPSLLKSVGVLQAAARQGQILQTAILQLEATLDRAEELLVKEQQRLPALRAEVERIKSQKEVPEAERKLWGETLEERLARVGKDMTRRSLNVFELERAIPKVEGQVKPARSAIAEAKVLRARVDETRHLALDVSPKLSQILELCVSASFGYWATLACLAAWARLQAPRGPNPGTESE